MHELVKNVSFRDLVNRSEILTFAQQVITQSYVEGVPGDEEPMQALLGEAFELLAACAGEPAGFQACLADLRSRVFRKDDPDFWFNRRYTHYKEAIKPQRRFQNLQPWLGGRRVLDLGCGDGLTSLVLSQNGYSVFLTDVLDYRNPAARDLPFARMTSAGQIPGGDERFDSAIVLAVLHHVEGQDLLPLLGELRQRSRRVIVEEDSFDLPGDLPGLERILAQDEQLRAFHSLSTQDQLRYLMFVDYFANAITQGITEMDMPFNFRSVGEWQALFTEQGFWVTRTQVMGFQKGFFNRSCHVWFILEAL